MSMGAIHVACMYVRISVEGVMLVASQVVVEVKEEGGDINFGSDSWG